MILSRKWRLAALVALLLIGAWLVLSVWALRDSASLLAFAALLPAVLCIFSWSLQAYPVPAPEGVSLPTQAPRGACGSRAPPFDLL